MLSPSLRARAVGGQAHKPREIQTRMSTGQEVGERQGGEWDSYLEKPVFELPHWPPAAAGEGMSAWGSSEDRGPKASRFSSFQEWTSGAHS